ncbi:MAG TPA: HAMP domain-containing sensor histidine kinase, partial [bacterium]|nr:HAMP domain-containing sensor histidine kinase [bacterium]
DCAIAEAVTEFEKEQNENADRSVAEEAGFLIHELGNSLAAAAIAHQMIQKGRVGSAGVTSQVLGDALERMRHLIDSSQVEIRLRGHADGVKTTQIRLMDILNEVEANAAVIGKSKEIRLAFDVDPAIQVTVDPPLFFSALSNLLNNAIKFTKEKGNVRVRGRKSGGRILIEVEDECGGLPEGEIEDLFKPFIQRGADKTGMGLGLSFSRQAIEFNQGKLTARNIPGKGCAFTIDLPKGEETVQDTA